MDWETEESDTAERGYSMDDMKLTVEIEYEELEKEKEQLREKTKFNAEEFKLKANYRCKMYALTIMLATVIFAFLYCGW